MAKTPYKTVSQLKKPIAARTLVQLLREKAGLGTREMAAHAGVSAATISRIEAGKAPDITSALLLARFLETTVEELFSDFAERKEAKNG